MKQTINKLFSVTMALLLLASTTSWTVGKHYCMGHLMDVSLFTAADDCGMAMTTSTEDTSQIADNNSCCNDELIIVEGQDDLKVSFEEIRLDQQLFFISFPYSYLSIFNDLAERPAPHEQYPPPILLKDIQLLDDVFLI